MTGPNSSVGGSGRVTPIPSNPRSPVLVVDDDADVRDSLREFKPDLVVRHQPTINADRVHVSVDVPDGWMIDRAPNMERPFDRRATASMDLEKTTHFRVHIVREPGTWDLWDRLEAGR